jgi:dTMP kinase
MKTMLSTSFSQPTVGRQRKFKIQACRNPKLIPVRTSIRSDIEAGTTVIIDRYFYSGCVYSAAKDNPALSLAWAHHPEVGLPRPDVVLFLDIAPEEAAKRGGFGAEKYENKKTQDRVRELYGEIQRSPDASDFLRIDAGKTTQEVEEAIWSASMDVFRRVDTGNEPLRTVQPWS